ncbi:MAG: molybdopterin-dependent oxidoreductase [Hoeflea sp.]|nr:molybdopterin-dependent oxidoreductase [Hoeflea sp.]
MFSCLRTILAATTVLAISSLTAAANDVILSIDGEIAGGTQVDMTVEDLEALGMTTIVTKTPWHDKTVTFEGVSFADLLAKVGATGSNLAVLALNNYRSELPVEDIEKHGVILALKQDGAYMPVSDKGPLFVVYPFDANPALNTEVYYARSAWQVRSITVE